MATEIKPCSKLGEREKRASGVLRPGEQEDSHCDSSDSHATSRLILHHPEVHVYTGHAGESTCGLSFTPKALDLLLNWKYHTLSKDALHVTIPREKLLMTRVWPKLQSQTPCETVTPESKMSNNTVFFGSS